jgi:hypothetical protein
MANSGTYGIGQPSAIVMQYSYTCIGGSWFTGQATPFIRIYHTQSASQPDPGYSLFAKDSYDGVNFSAHVGPGGIQGILRGSAIQFNGWWPNVKKVGTFGDYPLVISYSGPFGQYTAATNGSPSDFNWIGGNGGSLLSFSPASTTSASLDGIADGTLIDTNGGQFFGNPSGQVNFWWSAGSVTFPTPIYLGQAATGTYFPWSSSMGSCQ